MNKETIRTVFTVCSFIVQTLVLLHLVGII